MCDELEVNEDELLPALESSLEVESLYQKITLPNSSDDVFLIDWFNADKGSDDELMLLRTALNELEAEEKQIIMMRYFDDRTQSEIGKRLNRSQVQVSRMEKKILCKIKEKLV